jgi:hypothetical protein
MDRVVHVSKPMRARSEALSMPICPSDYMGHWQPRRLPFASSPPELSFALVSVDPDDLPTTDLEDLIEGGLESPDTQVDVESTCEQVQVSLAGCEARLESVDLVPDEPDPEIEIEVEWDDEWLVEEPEETSGVQRARPLASLWEDEAQPACAAPEPAAPVGGGEIEPWWPPSLPRPVLPRFAQTTPHVPVRHPALVLAAAAVRSAVRPLQARAASVLEPAPANQVRRSDPPAARPRSLPRFEVSGLLRTGTWTAAEAQSPRREAWPVPAAVFGNCATCPYWPRR